jgi:ABC-type multidrug transport system fused ATPase/permease subunit
MVIQTEQKRKPRRVDFKENLKVYWSFLSKYKILLVFACLVALFNESLSFTEKYLFKIIIDKGTAFGDKVITVQVLTNILVLVAVVYLASILFKAIIKWFSLHLINALESKLITDLKRHFFNHLISLSHSFHISHKTGSLISRIGRGAGAMERMTDFIVFNIFPLSFQLLIAGISLIYFNATSAIVIGTTIACFILYSLMIQGIQRKHNDKLNTREDIEKGNLADFMTNIDSIKYYGKENAIKSKYASLTDKTRSSLLKYWNYFRWLDAGQNFILWTGTFLLVYFSLRSFIQGNITIGTVVLVYTVYGGLFGQIYGFMYGVRNYYRSMVDFHDLFQYGKIEQEVKDSENAKNIKINIGKIEFKDMKFKYQKNSLFDDFNLSIKPGEKVALVGHSGSGKTTLVKLLYRFYDVDKGKILIDGHDIRDIKQESLRSELSIVPQECILFDDTIYNNILFSRPGATKKEVIQAIKFAQLDKTIRNFPYKENTIVGERGVKLSGGEKQRVSIARALLADKKIVVLDEATSSLDSQTEHEIQADLQRLLHRRTSLIIAHRLSTIMRADRIVVLSHGKISQIGTHNQLISKKGIYKKLWNLQRGGYIGV